MQCLNLINDKKVVLMVFLVRFRPLKEQNRVISLPNLFINDSMEEGSGRGRAFKALNGIILHKK